MILNCKACGKNFVVPDNAISASGRVVQCGSCGNKWKQFPISEIKKTSPIAKAQKITSKPKNTRQIKKKAKKSMVRKSREIDLYSPEYLAKKHGIKLDSHENKKNTINNNVSFGFYSSLLLLLVIIIFLSRGLYFFQDFVIQKLPVTEFYINYFFESIRNMFEIWKNLISNY